MRCVKDRVISGLILTT